MKKALRILAAALALTAVFAFASCAEENTSANTEADKPAVSVTDTEKTADSTPDSANDTSSDSGSVVLPAVAGAWIEPNPMSSGLDELWVFEEDAKTFHLYQITKDTCKVQNTIDGTYELKENGEIVITMMGYPLTYTLSFEDNDTMVLSDHGTSSSYKRFVGTIIY